MKKRINLLKGHRTLAEKEGIFIKFKNLLIVFFFLILAVNIVIYLLLLDQNDNISQLNLLKKEFVEFFIQNKEADAKFAYFRNKEKQLNDFLNQDVNFYPYYNLLKQSLDNFAQGATLFLVEIDKTKSTNFTISFDNYDDLLAFLKFAESEDFLTNFNQLSLINFNKNELQANKTDYRLNFSGKFINLTSQEQ